MKNVFMCLISFAAVGEAFNNEAAYAAFQACIKDKFEVLVGPCGPDFKRMMETPECTPECQKAEEDFAAKVDAEARPCCSYMQRYKSECEKKFSGGLGKTVLMRYHYHCSKELDVFITAVTALLPLDFLSDNKNVAAVKPAPVKIGTVAVGAAGAGALGASVALAAASWNSRKQNVLIEN
eukprot:TRINITY_DN34869_c0_g2_i1.p1 TRINITY_DN34869_c0_g2~~TRINITY_DN34869_c0_g2_i1.p1  ORF type:complete len:180 (+),score=36.66 TRINITY_DN34869_c0_g2_i1:82-621(+)